MEIIPAIDLRAGHVVRFAQGDYSRETRYDIDPLALAQEYAAAGSRWLHVVDLDGARSGAIGNFPVIAALAESRLRVQAGGGIRSQDDAQRLFNTGVSRAVVGSVAVTDPEKVEQWISHFGADRICVALDTKQTTDGRWVLPVKGWTQTSTATLDDLAAHYAAVGAQHLLCTDIARDGMLSGPNLALYSHLREIAPALSMQASGGVRDMDDLRALRSQGAAAAILGRSLLEGRLSLADALAC